MNQENKQEQPISAWLTWGLVTAVVSMLIMFVTGLFSLVSGIELEIIEGSVDSFGDLISTTIIIGLAGFVLGALLGGLIFGNERE